MPILDAYNTMELQPNPGFTDDGVYFRNALAEFGHEALETAADGTFVLPDGMDLSKSMKRFAGGVTAGSTTIKKIPGGIAAQFLQGFFIKLRKSGQNQ